MCGTPSAFAARGLFAVLEERITSLFPLPTSIFSAFSKETKRDQTAALEAAIDTAVDGTDPRIRTVRGYRKKLRSTVQCALDHTEKIVEAIPGPLTMDRYAFSSDPYVHAFFGSANQLQEVVGNSRVMREYTRRDTREDTDRCCALLAMRRNEKTVLGVAHEGDSIRRDVKQVVVSFSDHMLLVPAATEAGARKQLKEHALTQLVECALQRIVSFKSQRQELEQRRSLFRSKLRNYQASGYGLEALGTADTAQQETPASVEQELQQIERDLQKAGAELATVNDYLSHVGHVLSRPHEYLSLASLMLRLNRMGLKIDPRSTQRADDLGLTEIDIKNQMRAVVSFVHISLEALSPNSPFGDELERYLSNRM